MIRQMSNCRVSVHVTKGGRRKIDKKNRFVKISD